MDPPESSAPPPRRPLLAIAAMLALGPVLGSLCGARFAAGFGDAGIDGAGALRAACVLGLVAWTSWHAARASSPCSDPTESLRGASVSRPGAGILVLLLLFGAARAASSARGTWPPSSEALAGTWHERWNDGERAQGWIADSRPVGARSQRLALPAGLARDGEALRVLRGAPAALSARGPRSPATAGSAIGSHVPEENFAEANSEEADTAEEHGSLEDAAAAREIGAGPVDAAAETNAQDGAPIEVRADELVRTAAVSRGESLPARWRDELARRAAGLADHRAGALARAFLLGDGAALDPELADLFTRNGLRHVLAVSGWHVAMMAWWIVRPLAAFAEWLAAQRPRQARWLSVSTLLVSIALCAAYAPLTGGGAPVRRAAIAVALAATAALFPRSPAGHGRRVDALSLWSAALACECWLDPLAVFDVSVGLSYAATLGLILGTRPIARRILEATGLARASPRELLFGPRRAALAALRRRAIAAVVTGVAASLAAVLATAPIVWSVFGEACPWGVLTTPLFAPLFVLLFASGMLVLFFPAGPFLPAFAFLADQLVDAMTWVDGFPGTPFLLPERPTWLVLLALGAIVLGWVRRRWTPAWGGAGSLDRFRPAEWRRAVLCGCAAALSLPWSAAPAEVELHVLDVGHGTAAVLRAPGDGVWIFDCGSRDRPRPAQDALAPLLRAWETDAPRVVLSHVDSDHAGGLPWLIERAPPRLWVGALPARWGERLPHTCARLDAEPGVLALPTRAPGLELYLLRGADDSRAGGNEGSRSLLVRGGGTHVLLCGDATAEGWPAAILERLESFRGGLLLAPHHGADGPRLGALLAAFRPRRVWISGGPSPGIAPELDRRGVPWRATVRDGPLSAVLAKLP